MFFVAVWFYKYIGLKCLRLEYLQPEFSSFVFSLNDVSLNISMYVCVFARFFTLIYLVKTVPVFSFPLMYGCCVLFHRFSFNILYIFTTGCALLGITDRVWIFFKLSTIDLVSDAGKSFVFSSEWSLGWFWNNFPTFSFKCFRMLLVLAKNLVY